MKVDKAAKNPNFDAHMSVMDWCAQAGFDVRQDELPALQNYVRLAAHEMRRAYCYVTDKKLFLFDRSVCHAALAMLGAAGTHIERAESFRSRVHDIVRLDLFPRWCTADEFLVRIERTTNDAERRMLAYYVHRSMKGSGVTPMYEFQTTTDTDQISKAPLLPVELLLTCLGVLEAHGPVPVFVTKQSSQH